MPRWPFLFLWTKSSKTKFWNFSTRPLTWAPRPKTEKRLQTFSKGEKRQSLQNADCKLLMKSSFSGTSFLDLPSIWGKIRLVLIMVRYFKGPLFSLWQFWIIEFHLHSFYRREWMWVQRMPWTWPQGAEIGRWSSIQKSQKCDQKQRRQDQE